ncbi:MAG: DUF1573 domain-containing protein [Candidatus Auribacter fodinae]|jgi:hypothetical protein|uniref:DUF1573 domain-containing protein n=1 Tax=Candidatus Auribacter fodinae TaxID=2093366 RepID=A0A3A4R000_9BACT|nr:MAG: DUF1573 domain-containing protein [Candidatus Auribacter fodinae]
MNKFALVLFAIITLICGQAAAEPDFEVKPEFIQFTQVAPGGKASLPCEFTNTGTEPLSIKSIRFSCGCLSSDFKPCTIGPESSISGMIHYDAKGKGPGAYTHKIYVRSNDPEQPIFGITVYALVEEPRRGLSLLTSTILFDLNTEPADSIKYIEIKNNDTRSYQIRELNPVSGVDIIPPKNNTIPSQSTIRIEVRLQPWVTRFPFEMSVPIVTDDENAPALYCTIRAVKNN